MPCVHICVIPTDRVWLLQDDWRIDDVGTWASKVAEPLSDEDERMIIASCPLISLWQPRAGSRASSMRSDVGAHSSGPGSPPEYSFAPSRPSAMSLRPATPAQESVAAFLKDPQVLACMDGGGGGSASSDDGSRNDDDIPEVLRVTPLQHAVGRWGSRAGSAVASWPSASGAPPTRPQTCRGLLSRNLLDGPLGGRGRGEVCSGAGKVGARPATAHAASGGRRLLSAREKLERRKGYKAPKPPTDDVSIFTRAAQARFRI